MLKLYNDQKEAAISKRKTFEFLEMEEKYINITNKNKQMNSEMNNMKTVQSLLTFQFEKKRISDEKS